MYQCLSPKIQHYFLPERNLYSTHTPFQEGNSFSWPSIANDGCFISQTWPKLNEKRSPAPELASSGGPSFKLLDPIMMQKSGNALPRNPFTKMAWSKVVFVKSRYVFHFSTVLPEASFLEPTPSSNPFKVALLIPYKNINMTKDGAKMASCGEPFFKSHSQ